LILTLGSALNKDGAALHIAVAAIFIAQVCYIRPCKTGKFLLRPY